MSLNGVSYTFEPLTLSGLTLVDSFGDFVPYHGAQGDINLNAQSITNINNLEATKASVGKYYQIYSYEVSTSIYHASIVLTTHDTPFPTGSFIQITQATPSLYNGVYEILGTGELVKFVVFNINHLPVGITYPVNAYAYLQNTGTLASISLACAADITSVSLATGNITCQDIGATTILATSELLTGRHYQVASYIVFVDNSLIATITLTNNEVPFSIGDTLTIIGSDTTLMNNTSYVVESLGASNFTVYNSTNIPHGDYFPPAAYIYKSATGYLEANDATVYGTITTTNIDAINILTTNVISPIYTTQVATDLNIKGKTGKAINMSINGTNVLQVTSTAIIPYQPITGYLTSALAASTYLTQTAGALLAPLASPVFSGVIKFPSASDQLSTAQMSINLGNTVSNNINLLTNKDTFTVVTNAVSSITGLNAFAGIHIQPFNVLGGQQDYYTGISWTSNVNITGSTHAGIYCRGTSYVGTRLHFCTTDNNLVGNKERMVLNQLGYLALNHTAPQTLLDVYGGVFNVWTGTRVAYGQSPLAGSIILGSTSTSYGGGTGASTASWQVGIMMETNANQEISVHHSGDSVRSLLYYEGGNHRIILGRNCGWGTSPVHTHDTLTVGSTLSVVGNIRPLGNTAIVWDTGNGIKGTSTGTYGNISTYGSGANAWIGYSCNDRYAFMMQDTDNNNGGIHSNSSNEGWLIYWRGGSTDKSVNIVKKCSIGTSDAPSYMCHIRGNHCVQGGDDSKTIYGPNSSWGCYLCIGGGTNRCTNSIAQVITTNGNLHIDCSTDSGRSLYLNYYAYNGGIGPANQNTQIWGPVYMNGLVNQNSNYSQIVSGINGAALMYSQFWSTISATQSAWAGGWSSANFNKTSAKSTLRFEGYCSYYVSSSSMNYINVRIYNSYTGQYSYYNTNLFTNVTYNHAPCPISFCIKDIDAGFCNVYWYMSGSNWISDSNDYITVTTIIQPD